MNKRITLLSICLLMVLVLTGCIKPYKRPHLVEIQPHETAFLIPLEGATKQLQDSFMSEDFLEENKVAAKRIEIPQRWLQDGRLYFQGRYIPTARVIRVDRSPVTREWTDMVDTGTSNKNQGIVAESRESIPFMARMNATIMIEREDAAKYLYYYNERPLEYIMDNEIRSMVQSIFAGISGRMELREIIIKKDIIINEIKSNVLPYFKERGITITVLGFQDQFEYLDSSIQEAINKRFREDELLETQRISNRREIEMAEAAAQAELNAQQIRNQKEVETAEARAKAARLMEESLEFQIRMKELDNQTIFYENFDGRLPQILGADSGFLLDLPGLK